MNDLMLDLETLSTRHDACILSIGACLFDIETGAIGETFHRFIAVDDSETRGHISFDTIKWWMQQSDEARSLLFKNKQSIDTETALLDLCAFVPRNKSLKVWSNGATFDLVIIRNDMDRQSLCLTWQYWQERDVRTMVDIAERLTGINTAKTVSFAGVKHDALADAVHQANYVSQAYQITQSKIIAN